MMSEDDLEIEIAAVGARLDVVAATSEGDCGSGGNRCTMTEILGAGVQLGPGVANPATGGEDSGGGMGDQEIECGGVDGPESNRRD